MNMIHNTESTQVLLRHDTHVGCLGTRHIIPGEIVATTEPTDGKGPGVVPSAVESRRWSGLTIYAI